MAVLVVSYAEGAYKQLLDARGLVQRGRLVLPTEAGRITYKQMEEAYLNADVKHKREKWLLRQPASSPDRC